MDVITAMHLQKEYPNDMIALPPHITWLDIQYVKYNYSKICATLNWGYPFTALDLVRNTNIKYVLTPNEVLEFKGSNELVSHSYEFKDAP